jgi:hypothetical protein
MHILTTLSFSFVILDNEGLFPPELTLPINNPLDLLPPNVFDNVSIQSPNNIKKSLTASFFVRVAVVIVKSVKSSNDNTSSLSLSKSVHSSSCSL